MKKISLKSEGNVFNVKRSERHKFCEQVIETSSPRGDFYYLVILSTLIVSFGLIKDNLVLVIGGMLVTPLLSPLLAVSLGLTVLDPKVIFRSLRIFLFSLALAVSVAYLTGFFFKPDLAGMELIGIMKPSISAFFVAIVAGLAASYSWAKPNLSTTLTGTAVTVTVIPPLTAVGLALSVGNAAALVDVSNVLVINICGIILASIFTFLLMEFHKAKKKLVEEVEEEAKELAK